MVNFTWTDQQITYGVPAFDEEHQDLARMLNELCIAIDEDNFERMGKLFETFRDAMFGHFAHEEQVMRDTAYPGYEQHLQEHSNLMKELDETGQHLSNVRDKDMDMFLVNHLSYILLGHIMTTDALYMPYFKEKGII